MSRATHLWVDPNTQVGKVIALAKAAGLDDACIRAVALDPRIHDLASAQAVVQEAQDTFAIAELVANRSAFLVYDMRAVARDFVLHRIPLACLRADIVSLLADADDALEIDTARPLSPADGRATTGVTSELNEISRQFWAAKNAAKGAKV